MPNKMEKKVALITGGTRGIGKACVKEFADKGYSIAFTYITSDKKAKEIEKELKKTGINCFSSKVDNSKKVEIEKVVKEVIDKFGHIDVLINNAGVSDNKKIEDITENDWDNILDTNLKGTFFFSQQVFKHMKKRKQGHIINIASQAGITGGYHIGAHYSTSKSGILCLTKSLAKNGAEHGILVNSVSPGIIKTDMIDSLPAYAKKDLAKKIPLGKFGKTEDVASVVLFLASDESGYITGANIPVNGGMLMV